MKDRSLRREVVLTLLTLCVVLLVGLNSSRYFTRIDLTENNIYSISEVSKNLFREIDGKVRIRYYVSDKLKEVTTIPETIEDLLQEYSAYGRGSINLRVVKPDTDKIEEDLEELGIYPRQIEVVEENERSYAQVYSGILVQYRDRSEVIPLALRVETLEYELTSAIRRVLYPEKKRIGVVVAHPERSVENSYSLFRQHLSRRYALVPLSVGERIPDGMDVLVVFGAGDFTLEGSHRIENYIRGGGKALFAVGGVSVDVQGNLGASKIEEGNPLLELLSRYGVDVRRRLLLDAFSRRFRIPRRSSSGTDWEILDSYPHWIQVRSTGTNPDHPISARLGGLDLLWPSPLDYEESESLRIEELISTSTKSWTMDAPFRTNPYRSSSFYPREEDLEDGPYTAAVSIEAAIEGNSSRMVVIGDSLFASDFIQFSDSMYNLDFIENCVDWLALEEDMMQIRTRNLRPRGLDRLPEERADFQYGFAKLVNLFLVPLFIVGFALLRKAQRRRRRK